MASGSTGRAGNSGSKEFDFASDDILSSYEDYGNQDGNNVTLSDSSIGTNPNKEFHKSRMARTSVYPTSTYSPPEESSCNQDVLTIEKTMKKYTDYLMCFLEGISSRLSQLELYCYNLDKSIGEMRTDLVRDHEESEMKLKSLEKHMHEVHGSVQILRGKLELADTQKELAKLQLAQKDSSSAVWKEEKTSPLASEEKKSENSPDVKSQQLALVPHQAAPQPSICARPVEYQQPLMAPPSMPSQTMPQVYQAYYLPPQMTNQTISSHPSQTQCIPAQAQPQDFSRMSPQPMQSQVNQGPQVQSFPPYQQQWPQPQTRPQPQPQPQQQPVQPSQQPVMQPQIRPSSLAIYSSYLPNQSNQSPADMTPNSIPVQVSYAGAVQHGSVGPDALPYGYGATGRPIQLQPSTQNSKTGFVTQSADVYMNSGSHPALTTPGTAYMMFDGEGGRANHAPRHSHFQQGAYPPTNIPLNSQHIPGANMIVPQFTRNHPYNELIEKLVSMGYRGDHVVGVIQRLEESGQPIDFNAVLDRLNRHSSGSSQRGWSG